jgi:hypothetical protein
LAAQAAQAVPVGQVPAPVLPGVQAVLPEIPGTPQEAESSPQVGMSSSTFRLLAEMLLLVGAWQQQEARAVKLRAPPGNQARVVWVEWAPLRRVEASSMRVAMSASQTIPSSVATRLLHLRAERVAQQAPVQLQRLPGQVASAALLLVVGSTWQLVLVLSHRHELARTRLRALQVV